ncbi:MAG: low temperature requirement protein A [Oscillospiraceae bacterium]|nr:low temperature requirement protein A [Oscillospiraceae bacterium]
MLSFGGEKKVEYLELVYDLIFVYLVGRSNALLHTMEGGFFTVTTYLTYLTATLVILQVWYFSSLFINRYGTNGVADHVCLFINMYLLYYLADGTRLEAGYYVRYNTAWGLILLNLAVQYFLKMRVSGGMMPWESRHIKHHIRLLLLQSALVFAAIPIFLKTGLMLSWATLVVGFIAAALTARIDGLVPVNFEHLTERVMLYIVFTFGEMVVAIAEYIESGFALHGVYFSLMAFLIVVAQLLSYGILYNHIIDREMHTTGTVYMLLHIVLVLALNNITAALEFMREPEVNDVAKNVFLVASFLGYHIFLFLIGLFSHERYHAGIRSVAAFAAASVLFALAMAACYRNSRVSIAVSVLYVYAVFGMIAHRWRTGDGRETHE